MVDTVVCRMKWTFSGWAPHQYVWPPHCPPQHTSVRTATDVTTHVLHLRSLLLVHLFGPLSKSLIALFGMLHLVYETNSPLIPASLVRYSLLHFHLSHMAVHHHLLRHLHYHHLHLLLLAQSFILTLRLGGSLANHFHHRPFPLLPN